MTKTGSVASFLWGNAALYYVVCIVNAIPGTGGPQDVNPEFVVPGVFTLTFMLLVNSAIIMSNWDSLKYAWKTEDKK